MKGKTLYTTAASLLVFTTATPPLASAASSPVSLPTTSFQTALVPCTNTTFSSSSLGSCGGDALTTGSVALSGGNIVVSVKGALADPFNLYEVYWLPIGMPVTAAVLLDNFVTDCNGTANKAGLKPIAKGSDARTSVGVKTNIHTRVGNSSAGNFLIYSRGPYAADTNADCKADTYNTTVSPNDTRAANTLANPPVTLGIDEVQFISGFTGGTTGGVPGTGTPPNGTGTGTGTPPPNGTAGTGTPPNGTGTGTGTPPPNGTAGTGTPPNGTGAGTPPPNGTGTPPPNSTAGTGTGTGVPAAGG